MSESKRNALVLVAIAAIAFLLFDHGGGEAIAWLRFLLNLAFVLIIGWAMVVWYRNRAGTISLMDAKWRTLLQVCGVAAWVVYATGTLLPGWSTWSGGYTLLWFVLLAACIAGIYHAWQQRTWRW